MVSFPVQAVPTSVVAGPDGAHYVGLLTGAPFPAMAPGGLAVAGDGSVYVTTGTIIPGAGALLKITP